MVIDSYPLFSKKRETYKVELINEIPESEEITIYKQGKWLDLCRGPHGQSTKDIGEGFKLTKVAGAYWRGDSSKTMLTRIYGTAWRNKKELENYLIQLEEAEKQLQELLRREQKDVVADEIHQSLGDYHWMHGTARNWHQARPSIKKLSTTEER